MAKLPASSAKIVSLVCLGGRMIFKDGLNFNLLISLIEQTHKQFQQQAIKAVNIALTIRNWLVGYYIVEFEQKGEDRAEYGSKLLSKLAESSKHIKGFDERSFRNFRLFYKQYPQIQRHILRHFPNLSIWGSPTTKFDTHTNLVPVEKILSHLSYTHLNP